MSICTHHEPCPQCRGQGRDIKGDNLACYDDGHKYCFACGYWEGGTDKGYIPMEETETINDDWKPYNGSCKPLSHRGIGEDMTRKFEYQQ